MDLSALVILAHLLVAFFVLGVPALLGLLIALHLGVRSRPLQCIFALSFPCLSSYVLAGVALGDAAAGRVAVCCFEGASLVAVVLLLRRDSRSLGVLRSWSGVAVMTLGAACFALGLGFLHGITTVHVHMAPLAATSRFRYLPALPIDTNLPYYFAQALRASARPIPDVLHSGWAYSDRPPLQSTLYLLVLSVLPGGDHNELYYQVTGTLLQSLWVPALWCLLGAAGLPRKAVALCLVVVLTSGFAIVNSFFVWPKLLAGAFVVLLVAVIFTEEWAGARTSAIAGLGCGLAAGFSLLAHTGSAFALVPIGLFVLVRIHRLPSRRFVVAAAAALVCLVIPWTLFQTSYEPPGTALAKYQLAGEQQAKIDPHQSVFSAIKDAYAPLGDATIASRKWSNVVIPFSHERGEISALRELAANLFARSGSGATAREAAVEELRGLGFYYLFPSAGLLLIGLPALLLLIVRRRSSSTVEPLFRWLIGLLVLTIVFTAIVLFDPSAAVIHNGTYATELLFYPLLLLSLYVLSPVLAVIVGVLQIAIGVVTYAVVDATWSLPRRTIGALRPDDAVLAAVGLLLVVVFCLLSSDREPRQEDRDNEALVPADGSSN